jgi:hypothetical protein
MTPSPTFQLVKSDLINLPSELAGATLVDFLSTRYDRFHAAILALGDDVGDEIRPKLYSISILCQSILAAVRAFETEGMPPALTLLNAGLDAVRPDLIAVADRNGETILRNQSLYRVRDGRGSPLSQPLELFHLPFELRNLAPSVRYSVAGTPCLYLANSIYTCWLECRLPKITQGAGGLEHIYAARFEFVRPAQLLDFCYPPWALSMALDSVENPFPGFSNLPLDNCPLGADPAERSAYLASWMAIWPLLMAVSLRTPPASSSGQYTPEYVIPQMLMAWVQQSLGFDGIRYFSTRELPGNSNYDYAIDYAFPAKTLKPSGHCPNLRSLFACTVPVSFGRVAAANLSRMFTDQDFSRAESKFRRYLIVDDTGIWHYYGTTYCDMEYVLEYASPEALCRIS